MVFLQAQTKYDSATINEWHTSFKQYCPTGRLTPAKFVEMYKICFPCENSEQFCDLVFRGFDADGNGYIDFKEFLLAVSITSGGTAREKLKWTFRIYDVDGNGVIEPDEMKKIANAIYAVWTASNKKGIAVAEERAEIFFARLDLNSDGHITEDEFVNACLEDTTLSTMLTQIMH